MDPWVFASPESVRWILEHPLPIFLCIVRKSEARILVYHTTPRFAAWAFQTHKNWLELVPGMEGAADTVQSGWVMGHNFELRAPILNFTIQQVLDRNFCDEVAKVLKYWIDFDVDNLFRIKSGIPYFRVPSNYETNSTRHTGMTEMGGPFTEAPLGTAKDRLKELMDVITRHYFQNNDLVSAAVYAAALRQLSPEGYQAGSFNPHHLPLHSALNTRFKLDRPYAYQAVDSLLQFLKDHLATHDIVPN